MGGNIAGNSCSRSHRGHGRCVGRLLACLHLFRAYITESELRRTRTGLRFERLVLTYQFEGPRRAQAVSRWWMYTDTQRAIDANRVELLYSRAMGSKFETQAVTTHI